MFFVPWSPLKYAERKSKNVLFMGPVATKDYGHGTPTFPLNLLPNLF